jgi:hypothetical protein
MMVAGMLRSLAMVGLVRCLSGVTKTTASFPCPLAPPGNGLARAVMKIAHDEKFFAARV